MIYRKRFTCFALLSVLLIAVACTSQKSANKNEQTTIQNPLVQKPSNEKQPFKEESLPNRDRIAGLYVASFFTDTHNAKKILTYAVEFFENKTARLMIFKNEAAAPDIFVGKWLVTKDAVIILYFENPLLASEFFKKRPDGNLSILRSDRSEYTGAAFDYMLAEKIK